MFPFLRRRATRQHQRRGDPDGPPPGKIEEPVELPGRHRRLLTALRLESGYSAAHFAELLEAVVLRYAELVHALPATWAEHHRERAGLLRFALECAFLAFRRADARILCATASTETRRQHERAWRYSAFLAALCAPLGRVATHVVVSAREGRLTWSPYHESLWTWITTHGLCGYVVSWRPARDAHPVHAASA
jgi:conjugal transfer pilus assembly protein TraI